MAKAQWTIRPQDAQMSVTNGTVRAVVPLRDGGAVQGRLVFTMTAERVLRVEWLAEPGAVGLSAFEAWSNT